MPEPSVFCTMTAALVCRRSQMPGTAPVPYRCHRQRTAALGVLSRPSFSRPEGLGSLCAWAASPSHSFPAFCEGGEGIPNTSWLRKPGRCQRPFPCMQTASVGEGKETHGERALTSRGVSRSSFIGSFEVLL